MVLFCGSYIPLRAHTSLSIHVQSLDLSSNLELSRQLNQMARLRNNRCLPSRARPLRCSCTCTLPSNLFWHLLCKKASFSYPGLVLRICLWEIVYFLISVNKDVRVISNYCRLERWAGEPWGNSGWKEYLPSGIHLTAATPYREPWGTQDTGPRELRCIWKEWLQWAQTLASFHT